MKTVLQGYALMMTITCYVFMGFVFFGEGILKSRVIYQEPNLFIAKMELVIVVLGAVSTVYLLGKEFK